MLKCSSVSLGFCLCSQFWGKYTDKIEYRTSAVNWRQIASLWFESRRPDGNGAGGHSWFGLLWPQAARVSLAPTPSLGSADGTAAPCAPGAGDGGCFSRARSFLAGFRLFLGCGGSLRVAVKHFVTPTHGKHFPFDTPRYTSSSDAEYKETAKTGSLELAYRKSLHF